MPIAPLLLACSVIAISDGGSLKARCETSAGLEAVRIRIAGIDAPERGQPHSRAARRALATLLADRPFAADCYKTDRYGRQVCRLGVGEADIGLEQIRAGLAWRYAAFEGEQSEAERAAYAQGEAQARSAHLGLWEEPSPVPPWQWRKAQR